MTDYFFYVTKVKISKNYIVGLLIWFPCYDGKLPIILRETSRQIVTRIHTGSAVQPLSLRDLPRTFSYSVGMENSVVWDSNTSLSGVEDSRVGSSG